MSALYAEDLSSVVFICTGEFETGPLSHMPVGTGFYLRLVDDEHPMSYFITARHVIENIPNKDIFIRINNKVTGTFGEIHTWKEDWFTHNKADVACLPFNMPIPREVVEQMQLIHIESSLLVDKDSTFRGKVGGQDFADSGVEFGVGTELVFLGLFTQSAGMESMKPVARFGHIARMPYPFTLKRYSNPNDQTTFEAEAYLAEAVAWGGQSGSPVLGVTPLWPQMTGAPGPFVPFHIRALIGLVTGHYQIPVQSEIEGGVVGSVKTNLNSGMALVTPAYAITELLMRDDVSELRKAAKKIDPDV
jgi:hypothetical protein